MSGRPVGSWACTPRPTIAGASRCGGGAWTRCVRRSAARHSRRAGLRPGWNSRSWPWPWPIPGWGQTDWWRSCGARGGAGIAAARTASGTSSAGPASIRAPSGWGCWRATRRRPSRGRGSRSPSATSRRPSRVTWCNWTVSTWANWRAPAGAPGSTPPSMSPPATPGPASTTPRAIPRPATPPP